MGWSLLVVNCSAQTSNEAFYELVRVIDPQDLPVPELGLGELMEASRGPAPGRTPFSRSWSISEEEVELHGRLRYCNERSGNVSAGVLADKSTVCFARESAAMCLSLYCAYRWPFTHDPLNFPIRFAGNAPQES
jgi:hypothetical protein